MTIMELNAYRAGWMEAVRQAQAVVEYNCDCKHADIIGLVGLLATDDPIFGYRVPGRTRDVPTTRTDADPGGQK